MTDRETLQERLRALSRCGHDDLSIGAEAADSLDAKDAEIARLRDRVEELEGEAETLSGEFDREVWVAVKGVLNHLNFPWSDYSDGVDADQAVQFIFDELADQERRIAALEPQP